MYVAVDDTDSNDGNCTTYLATEIIFELTKEFDLIGLPRLVRLNPAVPWKTRGNGSLIMEFGEGIGNKIKIGEINGKSIFSFENKKEKNYDTNEILKKITFLVEKYHDKNNSDPGLIVSNKKPNQKYYFYGLFKILNVSDVEKELKNIEASYFTINKGRGLIGSICGMAWIPNDFTYELLTYREPKKWGTERNYISTSIQKMDFTFESTFNSWDERNLKVTMVPSTPCPVLYGLRGDDFSDLIEGANVIVSEEKYRWLIFLTNQGTDNHILYSYDELIPNCSYSVEGEVIKCARHIKGGHTFIEIKTKFGNISCAAYEPTKEFRYVFDHLIEGDFVEVLGEYRESPSTLNVEKICIKKLAKMYEKISNPICPKCNKKMHSIGKNKGYRCKECHTFSDNPPTIEKERNIVEGWYEPPAFARRHLSKPLKRMGIVQPCEFVNRRS